MQESLYQLPFLFELGEDMKRSMQLGLIAGIVPGVITTGGVFFLGWGYLSTIFLNLLSLSGGISAAIYPLYKYRNLANRNRPVDQENEFTIESFKLQTESKHVDFVQRDESPDVEPSAAGDPPPKH